MSHGYSAVGEVGRTPLHLFAFCGAAFELLQYSCAMMIQPSHLRPRSLDLGRAPLLSQKSFRVSRSFSDPGVVSSFKSAADTATAAAPVDIPSSASSAVAPSLPPDTSAVPSSPKSDKCCVQ
jgi:hypothetical protein